MSKVKPKITKEQFIERDAHKCGITVAEHKRMMIVVPCCDAPICTGWGTEPRLKSKK